MRTINYFSSVLVLGLGVTLAGEAWSSSDDGGPTITKNPQGQETQASQAEPGAVKEGGGAFERPAEKPDLKPVDLHKKFPGSEATPYALGMANAIEGESMENYKNRMGAVEPSKVGQPSPQPPSDEGGYPEIDGKALSASEKKIWDVKNFDELTAMGNKITSMVETGKIEKNSPMWNWNITPYSNPDVVPDGLNEGKTALIKAWRDLKKKGLLPGPLK